MAWICLMLAGLFEVGWPIGLKFGWTNEGLRYWPLGVSVACMGCSGVLLLIAQRTIPMGTAYAVWTGVGAVGTFCVGLVFFKEPATVGRIVCVSLIAAGIVGLKLVSSTPESDV